MSGQLWTENPLVQRLSASWNSGEQLVLERSDEASAKNLEGLAELYWVKLSHLATLKMEICAVGEDLTAACRHLDDLNSRLSVALTAALHSPHRFMSWNEANAATPEWLDLVKSMTPAHPEEFREELSGQLQARAILDATRPMDTSRSRYNNFARQLHSVIRFAKSIPELLSHSDVNREAVLASFSCLTELTAAISKLKSLKGHEDRLRMLSHLANESFRDLDFHTHEDIIEGLEKPMQSAQANFPDIHHMSRSLLVLTAQRILHEALEKDDRRKQNEAPFAEAMMAFKAFITYEAVTSAYGRAEKAYNFAYKVCNRFQDIGLWEKAG